MMQIDTGSGSTINKKDAKIDNLYDLLFNGSGQTKSQASLTKKVVISGERLDFLEHPNPGSNVAFVESFGGKKVVEVDKVKISKQFKLVNPVPKFQSVPATPQFIDLAGAHISYPSLEEPMSKFKSTAAAGGGGLFKKITGLFGR